MAATHPQRNNISGPLILIAIEYAGSTDGTGF
jgi:hypothetical protein